MSAAKASALRCVRRTVRARPSHMNPNSSFVGITLEAAEIRHYFTQPHLLPAGDQHYCEGSLLQLLRSRPAHRRRWLMRVRRARANLISEQHRQVKITSYFIRQTSTDPKSSGKHDHHPIGNPPDDRQYTERRSTTKPQYIQPIPSQQAPPHQQPKMTHFFPGRPPDTSLTMRHSTKPPASK